METYNSIVKFFDDGGIFMYLIMIMWALGIAIAIERFIYLNLSRSQSRSIWDELSPMIKSGNYVKAMDIAASKKSVVGNIVGYGLQSYRTARQREDIEVAMEEGLMEAVPRLEKRTPYLATFANICTLLGLLGTIMGLIDAFTAISKVDPAQKADLLSGSISMAMNTTAFGLMAAIPLLLIHSFLQTKTTELVDSLEMAVVKFLNIIMERARIQESQSR